MHKAQPQPQLSKESKPRLPLPRKASLGLPDVDGDLFGSRWAANVEQQAGLGHGHVKRECPRATGRGRLPPTRSPRPPDLAARPPLVCNAPWHTQRCTRWRPADRYRHLGPRRAGGPGRQGAGAWHTAQYGDGEVQPGPSNAWHGSSERSWQSALTRAGVRADSQEGERAAALAAGTRRKVPQRRHQRKLAAEAGGLVAAGSTHAGARTHACLGRQGTGGGEGRG